MKSISLKELGIALVFLTYILVFALLGAAIMSFIVHMLARVVQGDGVRIGDAMFWFFTVFYIVGQFLFVALKLRR